MDDVLDWRPIAQRLRDGWRVIALTATVALGASVVLSLLDPYRYEAEAVLAVAKPDPDLEFEAPLREPAPNPAGSYHVGSLRIYPELVASDAVAQEVLERLGESAGGIRTVEDLRRLVQVQARADGSLIAIRARARSAEQAAELANVWAEVFSARMEALFGATAQAASIAAARDRAQDELTEAEAAVVAFHQTSRLPALEAELVNMESQYDQLLRSDVRLAAVARDADALRPQLAAGAGQDLSLQLAGLSLQVNALTSGEGLPVALELPPGAFDDGISPAELDALGSAIRSARTAIATTTQDLGARLAELRANVEREQTDLDRLGRMRGLAEQRYLTLAQKAGALEVARQTMRPEVRPASPAIAPAGPELGQALRNALLALSLGILAGAMLVLVRPSSATGRL